MLNNHFFDIRRSHCVEQAVIVHSETDGAAYGVVAAAPGHIQNDVVAAAANDLQPLIRTGKTG